MKYNAGDIANLLGISVVAVRNYEKYGLITPERDEQNNYRKYHPIDLNVIRRARSYMSYGFSQQEATRMLLEEDMDGVAQALELKEADIEKQLMRDYHLLMFTKRHAHYLRRIAASQYECAIEMSPAFYGFTYRDNIQIVEDERLRQYTKDWNDIRPFAETFVVYEQSCFCDYKTRDKAGLCIEEEYASFFDIQQDEYIRYYPRRRAIHTIVPHVYEPDINYDRFEFAYAADWAQERGLEITGDAFGRVLHSSRMTGQWKHYMEMWIPID